MTKVEEVCRTTAGLILRKLRNLMKKCKTYGMKLVARTIFDKSGEKISRVTGNN